MPFIISSMTLTGVVAVTPSQATIAETRTQTKNLPNENETDQFR
jgi:hypothetical protein